MRWLHSDHILVNLMKKQMRRTYSELIKIPDYLDRFRYCQLHGEVGKETFGFDRYLNQKFYSSKEWKSLREAIIIRDNGFDLGHPDVTINGRIYVHHLNPLTLKELAEGGEDLFNPENFISVSYDTHNAIHFGDESLLPKGPVTRFPNDTCPWK